MLKDKAQSIKSSMEMPATVRRLANAILSMEPEYNIKEPKFESDEELNQIRVDITELIVTELYQMDFLETSRLIEFGKVVSGVFARRDQVVFQYDKWYINPFYLFLQDLDENSIFAVKGNKPSVVFGEKTIASILIGVGVFNIYDVLGENLMSKKWIKHMTKKESIYSIIISILNIYIYIMAADLEEMLNDKRHKGLLTTDNRVKTDKTSLRGVNFMTERIMDIVLGNEALDDLVDLFTNVIISYGPSGRGIRDYWIEFGEFYLKLDCSDFPGLEMDLLKNLKHKKDSSLTVREIFNKNIQLQEEARNTIRNRMS